MNEDDLDRVETRIGLRAIREVLYGGERGPGLIYSVASLADSIAKLSDTVNMIAHDLNNDNGVKSTVRDLNKKMAVIEKYASRVIWGLVLIGIANVITTGRVIYTVFER